MKKFQFLCVLNKKQEYGSSTSICNSRGGARWNFQRLVNDDATKFESFIVLCFLTIGQLPKGCLVSYITRNPSSVVHITDATYGCSFIFEYERTASNWAIGNCHCHAAISIYNSPSIHNIYPPCRSHTRRPCPCSCPCNAATFHLHTTLER